MNNLNRYDFGCGPNCLFGYVGVDAKHLPGVDIVLEARKWKDYFKPNTASIIHSCHFIEHVTIKDAESILRLWLKMLVPAGRLIMFFPDLIKVNPNLPKTNLEISSEIPLWYAYGTRQDKYEYHRSFWDLENAMTIVRKVGYIGVKSIPYMGSLHYRDWTSGIQAYKSKSKK